MADNEDKKAVDRSEEPKVTRSNDTPAQPDQGNEVDLSGGVSDGTVEKTNEELDEEIRNRIDHEEKIVHDTDDSGNVVGWHKVPADGSTPEEQEAVVKGWNEVDESEENK